MPKPDDSAGEEKRPPHPAWTIGRLLLVTLLVLAAVWVVRNYQGVWFKGATPEWEEGEATAVEIDSSAPAPKVGEPAPAFAAADTEGEAVAVPGTPGKPAWVVFNATWCANCRAEIPDVQAAYEEYSDQVEIVSVYVSDTEGAVADYAKTLGLTYPQVVDQDNQIGALYKVAGIPAHVFVDGDGNIAALDVGALSAKAIETRLTELLQ